jgi:hypothetical protein
MSNENQSPNQKYMVFLGLVILNLVQDLTCLREAAPAKAGLIGPMGEMLKGTSA